MLSTHILHHIFKKFFDAGRDTMKHSLTNFEFDSHQHPLILIYGEG